MSLRFGSVCSGIEAASVAWHPLGWRAAWLAEIEPFPCAVLAHHYPGVPNLGDMTTITGRVLSGEAEAPEVFTGGTPCQAFSVAGKRESLNDARGNLSLTFCEIADAIDHVRTRRGDEPSIIVWENVPGVLSTADNAFGCFLGALAGSGCELQPTSERKGRWSNAGCVYGPRRTVAWRVLDAQYFGLAQRRRRVFVVASARIGFDPAAVLLESDGVRRDSAPRREAGKDTAGSTGDGLARCLTTGEAKRQDWETCTMVAHTLRVPSNGAAWRGDGADNLIPTTAHTLRGEGFDASEDGTGRGTPLVPVAFSCKDYGADAGAISPTLRAMGHGASHANAGGQVAVAFHPTQEPIHSADGTTHCMGTGSSGGAATIAVAVALRGREGGSTAELGDDVGHTLRASTGGGDKPHVLTALAVRRLTPRECERLQGFPDDYTAIPWRGKAADACPDGPRYKALGNSWAVPVARWVGARIARSLKLNLEQAA